MKDKENSREIQFKEELVRKAKNGDTKAFSLLYAGVCKEMYKFALYMMKHTEDAEDAVVRPLYLHLKILRISRMRVVLKAGFLQF